MRVMVMVKGESGELAGYEEELVRAGIVLAGERLQPSAAGARVGVSGGARRVVDGPVTGSRELAGFWLWEVRSLDEAVEWAMRCPGESELEIRPVAEAQP